MSSLPVFLLLLGCCFYNTQLSAADCDEDEPYEGLRLSGTWLASGSSARDGRIYEEFIQLFWRPPRPRSENFTKFEVKYSQKSIPVLDFRVQTTNRRSKKFTDAPLSFDYDFQVRAYGEKGIGPWSKLERHIAEKGRFAPPRNVRVERLTPKRYSVTLDPPTLPSWPPITIHSYRIFYGYYASAAMIAWNQTEVLAGHAGATAEFTVWDAEKTYVVKVQAREQDGRYGNLSAVYLPSDIPAVTPGKPRNLHAASRTNTSVQLRWDHPNDWQTGTLNSYTLDYSSTTPSLYGGSSTVFMQSDATEYKAEYLDPATSYTFNLTAKYLGEPVPEGPAIIRVTTSA